MNLSYKVPHFPVEVFPGDFRNFVVDVARTMSCPTDFPGVFGLAVMSGGIGTARAVEIKENWTELPILFTGVVAPPASKKSPAFSLAMKPIFEIQHQLKKVYDNEMIDFNEEVVLAGNPKHHNITRPSMRRNYINDFTFEALAKILKYNPKGILMGMDELAGWVKSMDQYRSGKGSDKEKWLSIWSGSPIIADRASWDEPVIIPRTFVSVTGGIQPDRISLLNSKEQDGFFSRLLLVYPEPVRDEWTEEVVSKQVMEKYITRYNTLFELSSEYDLEKGHRPKVLPFTPKAREYFIHFFYTNLGDVEREFHPILKATFKKMEAYAARFALIIQLLFDADSSEIHENSMEGGVVLAEYFKAHARKIYALLQNEKVDGRIHHALERIKSRGGEISLRDCYTAKVAGCKNKTAAWTLFKDLERKGFGKIRELKPPTGGRPKVIFSISRNS